MALNCSSCLGLHFLAYIADFGLASLQNSMRQFFKNESLSLVLLYRSEEIKNRRGNIYSVNIYILIDLIYMVNYIHNDLYYINFFNIFLYKIFTISLVGFISLRVLIQVTLSPISSVKTE